MITIILFVVLLYCIWLAYGVNKQSKGLKKKVEVFKN
jgi:hypothetical protein